jgi:hypothetical protein
MRRSIFLGLVDRVLAHPRPALAAMALVTLAAAPGLTHLELRTDGHALVPPDDPAVLFDAEVRERFGLGDVIVVLLETGRPEGIYDLDTLSRLQQVSRAVAALDGVETGDVTSLDTERRDGVYPGTLIFRPFLDPLPDDDRLMEDLRSDLEAAQIVTGTLVSADHTAAAVLVEVPTAGGGDRSDFYRRVREAVVPFADADHRIRVVGAPVAETQLGTHVLEDLVRLLPLAILAITLVLWIGCRRIAGVALALTEIAACLIFTFGLMGWVGAPVYLTTAVLPVVLVTLGLADEIHVLWHYQRELSSAPAGEAPAAPVRRTFERLATPLTLTSLTTALAFLSFLVSEIRAVAGFGLFAAVGIGYCLLFTLVVVPAALALLPAERFTRPARAPSVGGTRVAAGLAPLLRRPGPTLGVLAAITAGLALGLPRLVVQDSWVDGFAPESELRRDIARVNEKLHGTHLLLVEVDFDPAAGAATAQVRDLEAPLLLPANLEAIGNLERFIREQPRVGGVLGPHSHLSTVAYLRLGRLEGTRRISEVPHQVEKTIQRFADARGEQRLREVFDPELRRGLVTIFLEDANYRDTAALMAAIRAYSRERLEPIGARVGFAGDVAVSQAMIPAIVRTQVGSLLTALAGALLIVILLYRSLTVGVLVILPAVTAVLWVFGAMAWTGVHLGVATSMFCAVTLGVGIDYAIHFFERYRLLRDSGATDPVAGALSEAGPAILADTVAIALGFGLLGLSQVPGNARLGLLVALALVSSCLLTLVGLGSLLAIRLRVRRPATAAGLARRAGEA